MQILDSIDLNRGKMIGNSRRQPEERERERERTKIGIHLCLWSHTGQRLCVIITKTTTEIKRRWWWWWWQIKKNKANSGKTKSICTSLSLWGLKSNGSVQHTNIHRDTKDVCLYLLAHYGEIWQRIQRDTKMEQIRANDDDYHHKQHIMFAQNLINSQWLIQTEKERKRERETETDRNWESKRERETDWES